MKISYHLILCFFLLQTVGIAQEKLNIDQDLFPFLDPSKAPFYHGVASGDPTENSVVIWTKVTLGTSVKKAVITYEIATDSLFNSIVQKGNSVTDETKDFTIKERIQALKSNHTYYYLFTYNSIFSIVGTTKTLPSKVESFNIAFASCSNYEFGYFTNYKLIAEDEAIDLVVHLGDYIYEYGVGVYGDTTIGRFNIPSHEIITLADYRTRYSLYRLDKDLMKLHQLKPITTTWDDHEIADNAYMTGAQNHQENEGSFLSRKDAAKKAYYEWLPITPKENEPLYRSFSVGSLINLIVLDTRIEERSKQVDSMQVSNYYDSTRTILGKKQFGWLQQNLRKNHTWKIICNQVPVGPMYYPSILKGEKYMDGWDGYPFEKEKFISYLQQQNIQNTIIVTGDYHRSIAMETDLNGTKEKEDNVAVEFVVTSITSANDDEYYSKEIAETRKALYLKNNPHMKYCNNTEHGYLTLHITPEEIIANYTNITTIKEKNGKKQIDKTFSVINGKSELIEK